MEEQEKEFAATQSEVRIFKTTHYDKFKLSEFNRDPAHYKKLVESIKDNDKTMYNPILVDKDLVIIDGQNRFLACKELKLPVNFIVAKDMHIFEAADINQASKNWTTMDYASHYANRGREEYIKLLDYAHKYDQRITVIMTFGRLSKGNRSHGKSVRSGNFKFREDIDVDAFFKHATEFREYLSFAKKDCFVKALLKMYMHENYDKDVMMKKLKKNSGIVHEQSRVDTMLDELLKLYNYRMKKKISF